MSEDTIEWFEIDESGQWWAVVGGKRTYKAKMVTKISTMEIPGDTQTLKVKVVENFDD